ncbi:T5orf172 domain-containing protein [Fusarium tricinctum]|uniref:T5orf172 domain-containing protein n=1 Tax=Fusarium tricinctum TaxID=61284 RepID=A0A8K0W5N6_9HYPO|nr:T5orf172 domain-containing protein [Fusarium tricinctum]
MSFRNNKKRKAAAHLGDSPKSQKLNSKSASHLNPPTLAPCEYETLPARSVPSFLNHPTTLPQSSSALVAYADQPTEEVSNTTILRTRLGLHNKKCGALTKSKEPCGALTCGAPAKTAAITSHLDTLIGLTQSSVEFEGELDELARLVHCRSHNNSFSRRARIGVWMEEFPIGDDPFIVAGRRIRKALALESTKCIGIVKPQNYRNDSYLDGFLKVLETNMYCNRHMNQKALQKVACWKSSIVEILDQSLSKLAKSDATEDTEERLGTTTELGNLESPLASSSDGLISGSGSQSISNFEGDLSAFWPVSYDTSPFEITEKSKKSPPHESLYENVKSKMIRDLENKDLEEGYIYLYEVDGNPGFVKIGYTTQSVEDRLKDWKDKCNRDPKTLYPNTSGGDTTVPNARRVEALCHAELEHRRVWIFCPSCLKPHTEWFETTSAKAIETIKKWSCWMKTQPYLSVKLGNEEKWKIKEEERQRTQDMNQFMIQILEAS